MNEGIISILGNQLGEDLTGRPLEYILLKMMQRIEGLEHKLLVAEFKVAQQGDGLANVAATLHMTDDQLARKIGEVEAAMLSRSKAVNARLSLLAEEMVG